MGQDEAGVGECKGHYEMGVADEGECTGEEREGGVGGILGRGGGVGGCECVVFLGIGGRLDGVYGVNGSQGWWRYEVRPRMRGMDGVRRCLDIKVLIIWVCSQQRYDAWHDARIYASHGASRSGGPLGGG